MKNYLVYIFLFLISSSCANILEDTANKSSDEAILYQARKYLASGDWTNAITEFNKLTAATAAQTDVIVDKASAYSGRCGLDFLTIASNINNFVGGSTRFFGMVLPLVVVSTQTKDDCIAAENLLKTIATNGVVDNLVGRFLMAFNSLAKISAILNFRADTDDDGLVDAGWDACGGAGLANLPNSDLNEIVTGFFLFINNFAGLAMGGTMPDYLSDCEAILGPGNCDVYDTASVTNTERWFIRAAIVETDDNVGLAIRASDLVTNAANPACQL